MRQRAARWQRSTMTLMAGALYFAALFFAVEADGGRDAALFYGIFGFAFSFPMLLLLGKLLAAGFGRLRPLGDGARATIPIALVLLLAGWLAYGGYRAQDPVAKFEWWVA